MIRTSGSRLRAIMRSQVGLAFVTLQSSNNVFGQAVHMHVPHYQAVYVSHTWHYTHLQTLQDKGTLPKRTRAPCPSPGKTQHRLHPYMAYVTVNQVSNQ